MKRLFGSMMVLACAAILTAAPQNPAPSTPDSNQGGPAAGKHGGKQTGKKHRGSGHGQHQKRNHQASHGKRGI